MTREQAAARARALVLELRQEWLRSGMSLQEIAEGIGVGTPQAISNMLSGRRDVIVTTLIRVADVLGFEVVLVRRRQRPTRPPR